jgi:hypothetical protein
MRGTSPHSHGLADFPNDELRARLRSLGVPGGRHRYRLLRQILRSEHGVDAAGTADDLASALINAIERHTTEPQS